MVDYYGLISNLLSISPFALPKNKIIAESDRLLLQPLPNLYLFCLVHANFLLSHA
jgi:hypothetical protein